MATERRRRSAGSSYKQIGVALPAPLSGRLDALVALAGLTGERTSRREVVAALVHHAISSGDPRAAVRAYRHAVVQDAFVAGYDAGVFLSPARGKGPRQLSLLEESADAATDPQEPLLAAQPLVQADSIRVGLAIPRVIDGRLDMLVNRMAKRGENTSRGEIIAALILSAKSGAEIEEQVRSLRRSLAYARSRRRRAAG